jgi:hypothetical protein
MPIPAKTTDEEYDALVADHLSRGPSRLQLTFTPKFPQIAHSGTARIGGEVRPVSFRWQNPKPLILSWALPEQAKAAASMVDRTDFDAELLWEPGQIYSEDRLWKEEDGEPVYQGTVDESRGRVLGLTDRETDEAIESWDDLETGWPFFSAGPFARTGRTVHFDSGDAVTHLFKGFNASVWNDRFFTDLMDALQ